MFPFSFLWSIIMRSNLQVVGLFVFITALVAGCTTAPTTEADRAMLNSEAELAIRKFKLDDPTILRFFETSVGFAIFPSVGKGAIGIGGAYGKGELFQNGVVVGYCDLTQATIGLQLGGQNYREIIFFETQQALDEFKAERFAVSAQASAVAVKTGAAKTAKYENGVAIFVGGEAGLMAEASVGGQKFNYVPKGTFD